MWLERRKRRDKTIHTRISGILASASLSESIGDSSASYGDLTGLEFDRGCEGDWGEEKEDGGESWDLEKHLEFKKV